MCDQHSSVTPRPSGAPSEVRACHRGRGSPPRGPAGPSPARDVSTSGDGSRAPCQRPCRSHRRHDTYLCTDHIPRPLPVWLPIRAARSSPVCDCFLLRHARLNPLNRGPSRFYPVFPSSTHPPPFMSWVSHPFLSLRLPACPSRLRVSASPSPSPLVSEDSPEGSLSDWAVMHMSLSAGNFSQRTISGQGKPYSCIRAPQLRSTFWHRLLHG